MIHTYDTAVWRPALYQGCDGLIVHCLVAFTAREYQGYNGLIAYYPVAFTSVLVGEVVREGYGKVGREERWGRRVR